MHSSNAAGGLLHLADLATDALMLLSLIKYGQTAYATASAAVLTLASLTSFLYTANDPTPVLRPEVGDTVHMARLGVSGKVVELVDADAGQARTEQAEVAR